MIKIINPEFFGYNLDFSGDYISINLMVDPQDFELKSYKRSPFASIIIKSSELVQKIKLLMQEGAVSYTTLLTLLNDKWVKSDFKQFNLYTDSEYEEYTSKFENRRFHTMIYYSDLDDYHEKYDTPSIMIGAFPLQGIVTPITKSYHYRMYNGCLISCKPFRWKDKHDFFNKLIYILVDIRSVFSFQEFIRTVDNDSGIMIDYRWYATCGEKIHKLSPILPIDSPMETTQVTRIPYKLCEDLFEKPMKNIFYLSDVPKDIMMKKETMSVKIN